MQETQVQSLGQEDPLEKEIATHSSILAWKNPMNKGAWWATVHGVTESWTRLINTHFEGWTFPWRFFTRVKTLSLHFPTEPPSLFCLLSLIPHRFFLSDL